MIAELLMKNKKVAFDVITKHDHLQETPAKVPEFFIFLFFVNHLKH